MYTQYIRYVITLERHNISMEYGPLSVVYISSSDLNIHIMHMHILVLSPAEFVFAVLDLAPTKQLVRC